MFKDLFCAVFAFFLAVALYAVIRRRHPHGSFIAQFFGSGILGFVFLLIWKGQERVSLEVIISILLLYIFMCGLYTFLIILVASSISVGFILLLRQHGIKRDKIDLLYQSSHMVKDRLENLNRLKMVQKRRDSYILTNRGQWILYIFVKVAQYFKHPWAL